MILVARSKSCAHGAMTCALVVASFVAGLMLGPHTRRPDQLELDGLFSELSARAREADVPSITQLRARMNEYGSNARVFELPVGDSRADCDREAAYWTSRLLYNELGFASMAAGAATNTIKWGFDHVANCTQPTDTSCYSFNNVECRFNGCSWFDSTEFTCHSLLHGESFQFVDVRRNCEVWAGFDGKVKITCGTDGLVPLPPA